MRARAAGKPRGDEERPRAKGDELEHADDLVDRRVVDVFLIAVVEPVELGRDDPQRQCQQQHRELNPGLRSVPAGHDQLREQIREDQAGSVGSEQSAPHEPAAAACRMSIGGAAPPLEQRFRPPVEHEHVEIEPRRRGLLEGAHALRPLSGVA